MDDEIKPLLYCRHPCNPKFHCCLWAARLGPVDKNQTLTQGKLDRALCNIEIWGLGVYLVGVCRVWSFCPSTVSWLYISYFKKVFLLVSLMHPFPTLQGTMTAKNHDCKAQWWQSTMIAKNNDCKEEWPQRKMTARKQWLQRTVPCKEQFWKSEVFHESFVFTSLTCRFWKEVSHESFHCTTSTCRFWRKLARKLRFHIFNSQILKDARAKAFLCTTSTGRFWRKSRTKTSFSSACSLIRGTKCAVPKTSALPANSGTNPCVFKLPNSKFLFLFYCLFYYLFLLPDSDYLCFCSQSGSAQSMRSKK